MEWLTAGLARRHCCEGWVSQIRWVRRIDWAARVFARGLVLDARVSILLFGLRFVAADPTSLRFAVARGPASTDFAQGRAEMTRVGP